MFKILSIVVATGPSSQGGASIRQLVIEFSDIRMADAAYKNMGIITQSSFVQYGIKLY